MINFEIHDQTSKTQLKLIKPFIFGKERGVAKFKSKINKDTSYQFQIPGIYAYWCTPHKSMGMIGFVVVGGSIENIENIKITVPSIVSK